MQSHRPLSLELHDEHHEMTFYSDYDRPKNGDAILPLKAHLLSLTAPEWVALVGGVRAMGSNFDGSSNGIFTDKVGVLSNDFFTVLTSMDFKWKKQDIAGTTFSLDDRATGETRFKALRSDLIFGSNSQLRAVAEVYTSADGHKRFVNDFVRVWDKVMMLDRYDVHV
jgi:catalase-peroxidase